MPKLLPESDQLIRLQLLLSLFRPVPPEWFTDANEPPPQPPVEALECYTYAELVDAWSDTRDEPDGKKGALVWQESIDVAFSLMLSVIASTKQQGAQLWLRVIGPPGSAKSSLCLAVEACQEYVKALSMLTGFHSGQGGNDLWSELDGKCCVINEGDMLVTAPNRDQTLAQMRDSWTGKVTAHYRNGVSYTRTGLRIPFIVAGTMTLRRLNRSAAGDRFLDIQLEEDNKVRGPAGTNLKLLKHIFSMEMEDGLAESDGKPESQSSAEQLFATRKTVGYIKYIRETLVKDLNRIVIPEWVPLACVQLAQLIAHMRARPDDKGEEHETEVELENRLVKQLGRLARCLALVLNKPAIDSEVMRRVAKVAHDTCRGTTFRTAKTLIKGPLDSSGIATRCGYTTVTARAAIQILLNIGWIKADTVTLESGAKGVRKGVYRLAPSAQTLMAKLRLLLNPQQETLANAAQTHLS